MYILIYARHLPNRPDQIKDHWQTFENIEDVERAYADVLQKPNLYSASICVPIKSTDYDTVNFTEGEANAKSA